MKHMIAETKRLFIRVQHKEDGPGLYTYLSRPEIYRYEPGAPITQEVAQILAEERAGGRDFLPVILKETGIMIGHLYFHQVTPIRFLTWELGFIFHPDYYNQGYATEASRAVIGHAFSSLGAHKVTAYTLSGNKASQRVLEKAGMIHEGVLREKGYFREDPEGRPLWHDAVAYGILEREWSEEGDAFS